VRSGHPIYRDITLDAEEDPAGLIVNGHLPCNGCQTTFAFLLFKIAVFRQRPAKCLIPEVLKGNYHRWALTLCNNAGGRLIFDCAKIAVESDYLALKCFRVLEDVCSALRAECLWLVWLHHVADHPERTRAKQQARPNDLENLLDHHLPHDLTAASLPKSVFVSSPTMVAP